MSGSAHRETTGRDGEPRAFGRSDVAWAVVVFAGAAAVYSTEWLNGIGGGVSVVGAERILAGDIPYRDFWTMYAPGHFYLEAALFALFGRHILVDTIAGSVVSALAACACGFLSRAAGLGRFASIAAAVIFAAAMYNTGYFKHLGSYPTSALFAFTGLGMAALYFRTSSRRGLVVSGLLVGTAVVFKHDVGGYAAAAIAVGIAALAMTSRDGRRPRSFAAGPTAFSVAAMLPVLPVLIYFSLAAGPEMFADLVVFPLTDFPYSRPELYPSLIPEKVFSSSGSKVLLESLNYLTFALPFAAFVSGIAAVFLALRRGMQGVAATVSMLSVLFLLHYFAAHVQINTHIVSLSAYGFLLGALFVHTATRRELRGRRVLAAAAAVYAVGWVIVLALPPAYGRWTARNKPKLQLGLPKVSHVFVDAAEAERLEQLHAFVAARVPRDEPIFVGLHRHDVTVVSEYMLYFILDRRGATRHDELHPAITDTPAVQREMVRDIEDKGVRLLVLKHMFADPRLDEIKADYLRNLPDVGARELDDYIVDWFEKAEQFGPYEVWLRRAVAE